MSNGLVTPKVLMVRKVGEHSGTYYHLDLPPMYPVEAKKYLLHNSLGKYGEEVEEVILICETEDPGKVIHYTLTTEKVRVENG